MAALPNEYEEQRRQRMLANQQRLQELGLLDAANPLSGAAEANRAVAVGRQRQRSRAEAAEAPPPEPTRRSRRMRGEAAENVGMQLGEGGASSGYARCGWAGGGMRCLARPPGSTAARLQPQ